MVTRWNVPLLLRWILGMLLTSVSLQIVKLLILVPR